MIQTILENLPRRKVLMVLTYHRIGDASSTKYDPGVFSATADEFDRHVGYLKARLPVIGLEEALEFVRRPKDARTSVLVTFDDGYRDNYDIAYPILRNHGVPATFFVCPSFLDTKRIPWWDQVAYLLRYARRDRLDLRYPVPLQVDRAAGFQKALRFLIDTFKDPATRDTERFLTELEEAAGTSRAAADDQLFLGWDQLREMVAAGMAVGSHTTNHPLLDKLPVDVQYAELVESKQRLERELGGPIRTFAYPGGKCTPETVACVELAGYDAAFSFHGGVNAPSYVEPFNVLRTCFECVDAEPARFRLKTTLALLLGRDRIF
jgi:peptidoglycan/xylan/chitin deacetylase (PgdA/CDA1 family)